MQILIQKYGKKTMCFLMVVCVSFNMLFYCYIRPRTVEAVALIPALAVAGKVVGSVLIAAGTLAGLYMTTEILDEACTELEDKIKVALHEGNQETADELEAERKELIEDSTTDYTSLFQSMLEHGAFDDSPLKNIVEVYVNDAVDATDAINDYVNGTGANMTLIGSGANPTLDDEGNATTNLGIGASSDTLSLISQQIQNAAKKYFADKANAREIPDVALPELPDTMYSRYRIYYRLEDEEQIFMLQTYSPTKEYVVYQESHSASHSGGCNFFETWFSKLIQYKYNTETDTWDKYSELGSTGIGGCDGIYSIVYNNYDMAYQDGEIYKNQKDFVAGGSNWK